MIFRARADGTIKTTDLRVDGISKKKGKQKKRSNTHLKKWTLCVLRTLSINWSKDYDYNYNYLLCDY